MFFPIGDVQVERGHKPLFSYLFIAINVLVFLYQVTMPVAQQEAFVLQYGSIPKEILNGKDYYTILTSIFLHGGWMHLIGNMLFLWVFADNIEATIGSPKFILFYLLGGVAATMAHSLLAPQSEVPCVGASGAISAVLGAYVVLFPRSQIKVLFLVFFTTFSVSAVYFLGFWIVQQLIAGVGSLQVKTMDTTGVAYWAHIGGFVFGLVAGFILKRKFSEPQRAQRRH
jgi:membrane associated rhomboid family serine protease